MFGQWRVRIMKLRHHWNLKSLADNTDVMLFIIITGLTRIIRSIGRIKGRFGVYSEEAETRRSI